MDVSVEELKQLCAVEPVAMPARVNSLPGDRFTGIKILVLQRGWVVVGRASHDGQYVTVSHGHVVRRWGTTKGLGELASSGPLSNTVLDPFCALTVHELGVVALFDCDQSKWSDQCKSTDS